MTIEEKIEAYIHKHSKWEEGLRILHQLLSESELEEDIKWNMPSYRINNKNVIAFTAFKNHFGLWFHNGSFLKDEHGILENAQEGKTKGMRHIKFSHASEIDKTVIKQYIEEAIQNQKEGKEIKIERKKSIAKEIPSALKSKLSKEGLTKFESLSNSKQNEYIEYITEAKREATVTKRLDKILPMIESGQGLNDMYKTKK